MQFHDDDVESQNVRKFAGSAAVQQLSVVTSVQFHGDNVEGPNKDFLLLVGRTTVVWSDLKMI